MIMSGKEQFETIGEGLLVRAPAKINLSLLIAGKRPDGFHDIETVMAKVNFFDELTIAPGRKRGIELVCTGPCWAPEGKENLVYQACELLMDSSGSWADIRITLTKNIPAGSGLGSASSDAAAAMKGVNELLQLGRTQQQLMSLAPGLGSDVAFFFGGPLGFCTGRGEKIKELDKNFDFSALLILPDVSVSTQRVYANYEHDPALYETLSSQINAHIMKNRIDLVWPMCANMLQTSCFSLHEELAGLKAEVESLDMGPVALSGSGSAMFCVLSGGPEERAEKDKNKLEKKTGCKSVIVSMNTS
jgi:4-diphosphocytidyl-2-C-methyl-D-erythritol kinase